MKARAESDHSTRLPRSGAFTVILWIGLLAGTLDIADNLIFNSLRGITPKTVFQYIASGLIGVKSFQSGAASVALGVELHYAIAMTWTGVFYAVSHKFGILGRRPLMAEPRVPIHESRRAGALWRSACA